MADRDDFNAFSALRRLARLYPRGAVPALIVLGLVSYAMEGIGISLFIPLLQTLQGAPLVAPGGLWTIPLPEFLASRDLEGRLLLISGFIFASILAKNLLGFGNAALHAWLNARITHRLRVAVVDQLLAVSDSWIDGRPSGRLANTLASETWRTGQALSGFVTMLVSGSAVLVFSLLLLAISWPMTLVVAGFSAAIALVTRLATAGMRRLGRDAVEANTALSTRMWEILGGMKVIRGFGREDSERARFGAASNRVRDAFFRMDLLSSVTGPLHETLTVLLVLGVIVESVLSGRTPLPVLVAFAMVLLRLQPQIRYLNSAWVGLSATAGAVDDVTGLLERADKPYLRSGTVRLAAPAREIAFDDVRFTYPGGDRPALDGITLTIPAGRTTALVGPSGAGKSTLINLICRFYEAQGGEIRVDGVPIAELDLALWRRCIGIVSQDIYMFGATVRENIAYGAEGAGEADVVAAARLADAHGFISALPQGYETPIGDGGASLSGGQRQRIALARAVIRDPRILILDEATNALDSFSEHLIQEALDRFAGGRTVIVIAHRLSTIERADKIVILEDGRVAEEGDRRSLLGSGGLFSRLHRLQTARGAGA